MVKPGWSALQKHCRAQILRLLARQCNISRPQQQCRGMRWSPARASAALQHALGRGAVAPEEPHIPGALHVQFARAGDQQGNIRVWDLTANACSCELVPEVGTAIRSITVAGDSSLVVAANHVGTCYVWRMQRGAGLTTHFEPHHKLKAHPGLHLSVKAGAQQPCGDCCSILVHPVGAGMA